MLIVEGLCHETIIYQWHAFGATEAEVKRKQLFIAQVKNNVTVQLTTVFLVCSRL